jgi:hypothetical protein
MRTTRLGTTRSLVVALVAVLGLATACSGPGDEDTSRGGWLDGSPADADAAARSSGGGGADERSGLASGAASVADAAATAAEVEPAPPAAGEVAPGLQAGSVDDNEDFAGYLRYRRRAQELGVGSRDLDVSLRHVVDVTGDDGRPVLGEPVEVVAGGAVVASVRTGTDGRAYVHPRAMGLAGDAPVSLRVAGVEQVPAATGPTTFELERPGGATAPVPLDVFFVLDATGSMGDELDRLTATVDSVVERISVLDGDPDVRLGMTVYRDEGDAFVTRTFDFTDDVAAFRTALGEVRADGGGDDPEALDEALAAALDEPTWRAPGEAVQLAFVIADAPPQIERDVATPYDESLRRAATRGVRIHSIGASGSDDGAEYALRQLAQFTGGRFVFLSYGVDGAALGPSTDIASVDYEELPLEDLLVRLVAESLADLTGDDVVVPSTSTTTTTDPQQRQGG